MTMSDLSSVVTVIVNEANVPALRPRETHTLHDVADMHR